MDHGDLSMVLDDLNIRKMEFRFFETWIKSPPRCAMDHKPFHNLRQNSELIVKFQPV